MNKLLYVAMSGAKGVMVRQATNNHNLSNVNTTGFREDLDDAVSFATRNDKQATRVYVDVQQAGINVETGTVVNTGRDLDIAIQGDGLIAVQNPDGSEAYTRAGNLRVTANGLLETADGFAVLGNDGPITVTPFESIEIAEDGTISVQPLGDTSGTVAVLDRIKLVNPAASELQKNENGLIEVKPKLVKTVVRRIDADGNTERQESTSLKPGIAPADASVGVISGALETSNVNPAHSLVTMVELSRVFEMQIKLMKTAEDNEAATDRILN